MQNTFSYEWFRLKTRFDTGEWQLRNGLLPVLITRILRETCIFFLLIWRANLGRVDYWDLNKDAPEGMTILIIVVICQT